jgi:aspartate kinase
MEKLVVQKYGGTSVGTIDRIKNIAQRIIDTKENGYKVLVVVSAMGKTTDELLDKAKAINREPSSRELDMLLSTGEQISISLLAMAIQALNHDVISLTGSQCGIMTDNHHKRAKISEIKTERIEKELLQNKIVIAAGFQGINESYDITTLGRGGSDTSAVAIAAALKAERCEIYTDVDGVYTSDPRVVKKARLMDKISYDEMLELAHLGAKVLHPRSVELARKFNIPLVVKSSFNNSKGTEIVEVNKLEKVLVRGITLDENIAKIVVMEVPDYPGIAYKLFSELASKNIHVDMIIQSVNHESVNDISFTVNKDDIESAVKISEEIGQSMKAKKVVHSTSVVKLSVVGTGIAGSAEVASKFFGTLYKLGINIQMISTSEIKISCLVDKDKAIEALQSLHKEFELDDTCA